MTIIEALEAAKAAGMAYFNTEDECDISIDMELFDLRNTPISSWFEGKEFEFCGRDIYRIEADGKRTSLAWFQTEDEVERERNAEADIDW